jgi:bacteriocin biosynthesis cyclodehydratase domain-containing protein
LPVILGDEAIHIGPVVSPGVTACLHCTDRHRTDADAAWPAIATQLLGRRSAIESALVASEVAAIVCRLVIGRLAGLSPLVDSIVLNARTGEVTLRPRPIHPTCGCSTLEGSDSANDFHPVSAHPR